MHQLTSRSLHRLRLASLCEIPPSCHTIPYLACIAFSAGLRSKLSLAMAESEAPARHQRGKLVLAVHPLRGCKPWVCLASARYRFLAIPCHTSLVPCFTSLCLHHLLASPSVMHDARVCEANQSRRLCGASLREAKRCGASPSCITFGLPR